MADRLELWQAIRFGNEVEAIAALKYYRDRTNPVDDKNMPERLESMIYAFKSGWRESRATLDSLERVEGLDEAIEYFEEFTPRCDGDMWAAMKIAAKNWQAMQGDG